MDISTLFFEKIRNWCARMDLNRRPPPYKGGALTAELRALNNKPKYSMYDNNFNPCLVGLYIVKPLVSC